MTSDPLLAGLQRRWRNLMAYGGVAIASAAFLGALGFRTNSGFVWATMAMGIWLYQAGFIARRLVMNHRPGETTLIAEFGPGTFTTILRGWLLACLAGFILIPRPPGLLAWAPALIYTLADVADYLDGYLARVSGQATLLGEALDIEFDALGLLIAVSVAVHHSALPVWYLPVGLARYAFILGMWTRQRAHKPIYPLPPSDSRRPLAGLQMGALSVILVPLLPTPVTSLGGALLAIPLLIGFARDWLVVSGAVDPTSAIYQKIRNGLRIILLRWVPLPLRVTVIAMVLQLGNAGRNVSEVANAGSPRLGFPLAGGHGDALWLIEPAAAAAVALGFAPRVSAIVLLATLLLRAAGGGSSPVLLAALTATVGVLMAGGGALSLWQPEVHWFRRRAGEKGVVE